MSIGESRARRVLEMEGRVGGPGGEPKPKIVLFIKTTPARGAVLVGVF
jgi:hypothetical protein